jgi:hypothetical protein
MHTPQQGAAAPSGYILVHPHFSPDSLTELSLSAPSRQNTHSSLFNAVAHLTRENTQARELVLRNERLHEFYCGEIDAIAGDPNSKLLILSSTFDWLAERYNPRQLSCMEKQTGLEGDNLIALYKALYQLQDRTIAYASEKLGDRLSVSNADPDDIEPEVLKFFGRSMKLEIFGETFSSCVKDAHRAIRENVEAEINQLKCPT